MSDLKKLCADAESKGLAGVSFDRDEGAKTAAEFLSRERIAWPNYHDQDGSLGRALATRNSLESPDRWRRQGYEVSNLKAAVGKLGSLPYLELTGS